jgi:GFO/IDH/MocA oxidoreductase family protein
VEGCAEGFRTERLDVAGADSTDLHLKNLIECVRTRQKPVADVEVSHRSTNVPHLGNIAFRTGRKIHWDAKREEILGWIRRPPSSSIVRRETRLI